MQKANMDSLLKQQQSALAIRREEAAARAEEKAYCAERALRAREYAALEGRNKLQAMEARAALTRARRSNLTAKTVAETRAIASLREQLKESISLSAAQGSSLRTLRKHSSLLTSLGIEFTELRSTADELVTSASAPHLNRQRPSSALPDLKPSPKAASAKRPSTAGAKAANSDQ